MICTYITCSDIVSDMPYNFKKPTNISKHQVQMYQQEKLFKSVFQHATESRAGVQLEDMSLKVILVEPEGFCSL